MELEGFGVGVDADAGDAYGDEVVAVGDWFDGDGGGGDGGGGVGGGGDCDFEAFGD